MMVHGYVSQLRQVKPSEKMAVAEAEMIDPAGR